MPTTTQTLCYNCFQQVADPAVPCPHCGFDLAENRQKFPVALQAGTVLNDRYIVGRVLGQGGFGITYVAFDTQLQARVAIKEYMPSDIATRVEGATVSIMMDTRADDFTYGAERFQEEARTLAKFIGHPNIAGVSSYFDENGTSYFVMDYIEGVSFKNYIANNGGKVSVDETLNVMIPVLRALTAVHAEGFIHRDVTPDNIYISKDGNVKLLDFGSARYSIGDKSKSLDVILKVGYAPKEQYIRRGRQGPYTDVYSCAACFYAALTGYLPPESLERLDHDELVPVSQSGVDIPEWLDKAILKGLAVQPEDRFQSAAEFLDAIENQLVVDVPVTGQTAPAQPAKKKLSPLVIGGVAAAIVVAVGLGAVLGGRGGGETTFHGSNESRQDDTPLKKAEVPSITIRGTEYSTDLQRLDLSDMSLTDEEILDLKYMINLRDLRLNRNRITDLTPLAGLTDLETLYLRENNLSDLSPLAGLTHLEVLSMGGGNGGVTDLSPLANMTKLTELVLSAQMDIQDPSPLSNLTSLEVFSVNGNQSKTGSAFSELTFLSGLTNLRSLDISTHGLKSLDGLQNLTKLTELNLSGYDMNLTDFSPLSGLTNLSSLYLNASGSGADAGTLSSPDLSFLSNMTNLRVLWFSATSLGSLKGIETAQNLTNLYLQGVGPDADLNVLSPLTELQSLSIYGSWPEYPKAETVNFMSDMTNLTSAELFVEGIKDVSALRGLTNLKELRLLDGGITDWSPTEHIEDVSIL